MPRPAPIFEGFKVFGKDTSNPLNPRPKSRATSPLRMATATGARAGTTRMTTSCRQISEPVPTEGVFLMEEIHEAYLEMFGEEEEAEE